MDAWQGKERRKREGGGIGRSKSINNIPNRLANRNSSIKPGSYTNYQVTLIQANLFILAN
jgi:hypothetical protein